MGTGVVEGGIRVVGKGEILGVRVIDHDEPPGEIVRFPKPRGDQKSRSKPWDCRPARPAGSEKEVRGSHDGETEAVGSHQRECSEKQPERRGKRVGRSSNR